MTKALCFGNNGGPSVRGDNGLPKVRSIEERRGLGIFTASAPLFVATLCTVDTLVLFLEVVHPKLPTVVQLFLDRSFFLRSVSTPKRRMSAEPDVARCNEGLKLTRSTST